MLTYSDGDIPESIEYKLWVGNYRQSQNGHSWKRPGRIFPCITCRKARQFESHHFIYMASLKNSKKKLRMFSNEHFLNRKKTVKY